MPKVKFTLHLISHLAYMLYLAVFLLVSYDHEHPVISKHEVAFWTWTFCRAIGEVYELDGFTRGAFRSCKPPPLYPGGAVSLHSNYVKLLCKLFANYLQIANICKLFANYLQTMCALCVHYLQTICKLRVHFSIQIDPRCMSRLRQIFATCGTRSISCCLRLQWSP